MKSLAKEIFIIIMTTMTLRTALKFHIKIIVFTLLSFIDLNGDRSLFLRQKVENSRLHRIRDQFVFQLNSVILRFRNSNSIS